MIALLALVALTGRPEWAMVGTSSSGLRIFVDRASIHDDAGLRGVTVRMGSPRTIVGKIVEVLQREQYDCARRRWRMVSFRAFDEAGRMVARTPASQPPGKMMPVADSSIGEAIYASICRNDRRGAAMPRAR